MEVNLNSGSYRIANNTQNASKYTTPPKVQPSFKGAQGLTQEQSDALKAQHIASQNINKQQSMPQVTEKDIDMQVCLTGCENTEGNTGDLRYFVTVNISNKYGTEWKDKFFQPYVFRNLNIYNDYKGENTVFLIPLSPDCKGKRGGDYSAIIFKKNIPPETASKLIDYMVKTKILKRDVLGSAKMNWCYLNTENPKAFFSRTNIKTVLANFFKSQETELPKTQKTAKTPVKDSDINIRNYSKQDKNNTREVKNYRDYFIKNGRKLTVGHSSYEQNGEKKDMTVILVPTKENIDDCVTITIDNQKLSKQQVEDMLNYLTYNNAGDTESEIFRKAIVKFLNS